MHESFDSETLNTPLTRRKMLGGSLGVVAAGTGLMLFDRGAAIASAAEASASAVTMNVANTSAIGALAVERMLQSGGYYKKFGVRANTTNVQTGTEVVAALASGSVDVTMLSGLVGIFPAISKGVPVKLLGGTEVVSTSAIFTGDPSIKSIADLRGKTIGVGSVGSELYDVFAALLRLKGISTSQVTFENVGSSANSFDAVVARKIDCGYGQVGDEAVAKAHGCRMIATVANTLPLWMNQGAVATESAISGKREGLIRLMAAYADLFKYLTTAGSKPSYVRAYVASGGTNASAELEWEFIHKNRAYSPTLSLPTSKVNFIQSQNVAAGSQTSVLPVSSYLHPGLASAAVHLVRQKTHKKK